MIPEKGTEEEPSFWKRAGEALKDVGNGLAVAGETMMDFAVDHPVLAGILIFGSVIIPGPQFGFI